MSKVVVLGAGVSGLTSALLLLDTFGPRISELTVVASELPGDYHAHDYASPWAGADWCSFAGDDEVEQIQRDKVTYTKLLELAEHEPETGIKKYKLKYYCSKERPMPWYIKEAFVQDIRMLPEEDLKYRNLDPTRFYGFEYLTVSISPVIFNSYIISHLKSLNVDFKRVSRLDKLQDVSAVMGYTPDLVINCTGVNAGKLLRDLDPAELEKVHPVKGQILQVYESLPFQIIIDDLPESDKPLDDQFLNIFPRLDGSCVIGGIFRKGDSSKDPVEGLSAKILHSVSSHVPELKTCSVYNEYTALRPGREGGVRIEASQYQLEENSSTLNVVHNYGIAGAGYQSSFGSAKEVSSLAKKFLE